MKWRNDYGRRLDERNTRVDGETKVAKFFAITPKRLHDGDSVWLEFYYKHYHWSIYYEGWVLDKINMNPGNY